MHAQKYEKRTIKALMFVSFWNGHHSGTKGNSLEPHGNRPATSNEHFEK